MNSSELAWLRKHENITLTLVRKHGIIALARKHENNTLAGQRKTPAGPGHLCQAKTRKYYTNDIFIKQRFLLAFVSLLEFRNVRS